MAFPPVIAVASETGVPHLDWSIGRRAGHIGHGSRCGRLVCWRPAGLRVAPPGDDRGKSRGDRTRQHRGSRALRGHRDRVVAHRYGDRRQPGSTEGRADLPAGVDDAADHALVGPCYPGRGDDHSAEGSSGRAEAHQHDCGEQRAVMTAGRQLGKHGEAGCGGQAGEHQHLADADAGREPGPERARGESDDSLRSDRQPGDQR
jgi:hypothetical protein